jgi:hypothetical protein
LSVTAEAPASEGEPPRATPLWLLRAAPVGWLLTAVVGISAPFGTFFIIRHESARGRGMRNDIALDGWGRPQGRYADTLNVEFPMYGAVLAGWAAVLLLAVALVLRARIRHLAGDAETPLVIGLLGSIGMTATAAVIWLAGFAWTSNGETVGGRVLSEAALGRGHLVALAAGGLALCCVGLCIAALWDWAGLPERRPTIRRVLAAVSMVVAGLAIAAPWATAYRLEVRAVSNEFSPQLLRYAVDGWGRISQTGSVGMTSHQTRFGIPLAAAGAIVLVGAAAVMMHDRGRGRWLGDMLGSLAHVTVLTIALIEAIVVHSALTTTGYEDAGLRYSSSVGLFSWLLWVAGVISAGWLVGSYWSLLPVWMKRMAHLHGSSDGPAEADEGNEDDEDDEGRDQRDAEGVRDPLPASAETLVSDDEAVATTTPAARPNHQKPPEPDDIVRF